jgi:hypothetical protein
MSNLDKQIEILLEKIKSKKVLVLKKEKEANNRWITNCCFPLEFGQNGNPKDNFALCKIPKIHNMVGNLILMKEKHEKVNKVLDMNEEFKVEGYTYEEWLADFKTRLAQVQLKEEKIKLEKLEEKAKSIMSEDQKRQAVLNDILSELD